MKNIKYVLDYAAGLLFVVFIATTTLSVLTGCNDMFDELENNSPAWLGENIYDYLNERGDCSYYIRLIEDCGERENMQKTGSNTLFFTSDAAFDRWFAENAASGKGPKCYDEMSASQKNMIMRLSIVSNAQLIERLSQGDVRGTVLRRATYFQPTDSIPQVLKTDIEALYPTNPYFAAIGEDTIRLMQDASVVTLTQFFPDVLQALKITDYDVRFITNGAATADEPSIYGNKIVRQDITCKNGYLHELENIILPPETMAGYINTNEDVSVFRKLMNRFATPVAYDSQANTYVLRYFNEHPQNKSSREQNITGALLYDVNGNDKSNACLYFDPGWNAYQAGTATSSTEAPYQTDMGVMFVPTDEALQEYFSATGEGADLYQSFGGDWDSIPDNIVADFVKNHQKYSFVSSLPHDFSIMKDEAGYDMNVSEDNIVNRYVARNGIVYTINKVLAPLDYKSVMGPAKVDQNNRIFNIALNDSHTQFMYYLRSLLNTFEFFITPDADMKHYVDPVSMYKTSDKQVFWNFRLSDANQIEAVAYSMETGDSVEHITNASIIKNRLNDIMRSHTIVVESEESFRQAVANGQRWFVTMGYVPLYISGTDAGGTVTGAGNSSAITITECADKSNGTSYIVNGLLQNTYTSTYKNLNQSENSSVLNPESQFSEFLNLCNAAGLFNNTASSTVVPGDPYLTFLQQYDYTIYVPTNEELKAAQRAHFIPSAEELEELYEESFEGTDSHIDSLFNIAQAKLKLFLRYHIHDNSVFIEGKKESNARYYTECINAQSNIFHPLYVTNSGNAITVEDNLGNVRNVNTTPGRYNIIGRDMKFTTTGGNMSNATAIDSYTCTVIHQIDKPLWYETPSGKWHEDLYNDLTEYRKLQAKRHPKTSKTSTLGSKRRFYKGVAD